MEEPPPRPGDALDSQLGGFAFVLQGQISIGRVNRGIPEKRAI